MNKLFKYLLAEAQLTTDKERDTAIKFAMAISSVMVVVMMAVMARYVAKSYGWF